MSDPVAKEPLEIKETSPSLLLSSLPDEMVLSCLARVSRSDHAALSLVSKRYHILVKSHELYKTRSLMGRTEERLYVCLAPYPYTTPLWFVLRRKNKTSTAEKTVNRLVPIPSLPSQPRESSIFVTLDWWIYVIGGFINEHRTTNVSLLDCRTNTWREVTSMGVARAGAAAGVVDGKIYVFGGCEKVDSSKWAEVYDPKTQTWDALVPMCDRNEGDNSIRESFVVEKKVYAVDTSQRCFWYSPREGKWGRKKNKCEEIKRLYCVIDKLLYGCDENGDLFWSEIEDFEWKKVKGLECYGMVYPSMGCIGKLRNFDANIVVFSFASSGFVNGYEVSLERLKEDGEIWGTIKSAERVARLDLAPFNQYHEFVDYLLYSTTVNV